MEAYFIHPNGCKICWTCNQCQTDNEFKTKFPAYPERVKWRCKNCGADSLVFNPRAWLETANYQLMAVNRATQLAKLRAEK